VVLFAWHKYNYIYAISSVRDQHETEMVLITRRW